MIKKLGKIFGEELHFGWRRSKISYPHKNEEDEENVTNSYGRILLIIVVLCGIFLLLAIKTFNLMVIQGNYNRELADQNRIRLNVLPAPRGVMYDRNNTPLVRNIPQYVVMQSDGKQKPIAREEALQIETGDVKEAGQLKVNISREYIYGSDLAHVLGYMSEVTDSELKEQSEKLKVNRYVIGDRIGRLGVEEEYEDTLRGINGKELVEVDAMGRTIKKIGEQSAVPGVDIHLTLDLKLQKLIADNFPNNEKGAVIASDPNTGEILAVYSSPSFDPNVFSGRVAPCKAGCNPQDILQDNNAPLFNRAISGTYPPGSTFKMVTSATGLESGKINKDTQIEDVGEIVIGSFRFPNWYYLQFGGKEGLVNIIKAIKRSNDIFFYKVGEMVGIDALVAMAKRFGLSQKLGIDLPGEFPGLIPNESWKQKVIGDNWYLGDTYHMAIGQGYLLVTPLQVNAMTSVIASSGKWCRPHLISDLSHLSNLGDLCKNLGLNKETVDLIREGMKEACSTGGTGWPFFEFKVKSEKLKVDERVEVGCKTGTAEFGDPKNRTHAWFTLFAPWDKPRITMTVLVEGAGEGGNIAAPIAKKVLEGWLSNSYQ